MEGKKDGLELEGQDLILRCVYDIKIGHALFSTPIFVVFISLYELYRSTCYTNLGFLVYFHFFFLFKILSVKCMISIMTVFQNHGNPSTAKCSF